MLALYLTACGGGGGGGGDTGPSSSSSSSSSSSGGSSGSGSSGGGEADTTPDEVVFPSVDNALPETLVVSSSVTVSGIDAPTLVEVSGGEFSIDGGAFSSESRTINNNQTLSVRLTSSAELGGEVWSDILIGEFITTFTVTTRGDINSPSAQIDYPVRDGVYVFDHEITVSGLANDDSAVATVSVNGIEGDYDTVSKKWNATIPLIEYGPTKINVEVRDIYDNRTEIPGITVHTTLDYDRLPRNGFAYSSANGGELLFGSPLKRYVLENNTYISVETDGWVEGLEGFVYNEAADFAIGYINGSLYRLDDFSGTPAQSEIYTGAGNIIDVAFDDGNNNVYFLIKDGYTYRLKSIDIVGNTVSVIKEINGDAFSKQFTALQWSNGSLVVSADEDSSGDSGGTLYSVDISTGAMTELVSFAGHPDFPISKILDLIYRRADDSFVFVGNHYLVSAGGYVGEIYRWDASSDNLVRLVDVNALEAFNLNLSSPHLVKKGDTGNLLLTTDDSGEIFEVNMVSGSVSQVTQPLRGAGSPLMITELRESLVYSAEDQKLYQSSPSAEHDSAGKVIAVNPVSGDRTVISGPNRGSGQAFTYIYDLKLGSAGTLYAVDGHRDAFSLLSIDIASGNRTLVSDNSTTDGLILNNAFEMEADLANNRAWVLSEKGRITSVSLATGEKTDLEDTSGQPIGEGKWVDIDAMAMTSDSQYLYLLGYRDWGQPYSVFKVDVEAGVVDMIANFSDPNELTGSLNMLLSDGEKTLIFVPSFAGDGLKTIAADFSTPLKEIPLRGARGLVAVARNPDSEYLFGLDRETNSVLEINAVGNAAVAISH